MYAVPSCIKLDVILDHISNGRVHKKISKLPVFENYPKAAAGHPCAFIETPTEAVILKFTSSKIVFGDDHPRYLLEGLESVDSDKTFEFSSVNFSGAEKKQYYVNDLIVIQKNSPAYQYFLDTTESFSSYSKRTVKSDTSFAPENFKEAAEHVARKSRSYFDKSYTCVHSVILLGKHQEVVDLSTKDYRKDK